MLAIFQNSQGLLLSHFQKCGVNVNYAPYCEVLLRLPDAVHRKRPGQLISGVQLHHDNVRPIQPEQPRTEFKILKSPSNK
jgi:hypothetical protein